MLLKAVECYCISCPKWWKKRTSVVLRSPSNYELLLHEQSQQCRWQSFHVNVPWRLAEPIHSKIQYYFLENICRKTKQLLFIWISIITFYKYHFSNILKTVFKFNFLTEVILNRIENAIKIPNGFSGLGTSSFAGAAFRK